MKIWFQNRRMKWKRSKKAQMEARSGKDSSGNSGSNRESGGDSSAEIMRMSNKKGNSSSRHQDKDFVSSSRYNNNDTKERNGGGGGGVDNGRLSGDLPSLKPSGNNNGSGNASLNSKQAKAQSHFMASSSGQDNNGNEDHRQPTPSTHFSLLHQVHAAAAVAASQQQHSLLKPSPVGVSLSLHPSHHHHHKSDSFTGYSDNGGAPAPISSGSSVSTASTDAACAESSDGGANVPFDSTAQESHGRLSGSENNKSEFYFDSNNLNLLNDVSNKFIQYILQVSC